MDIALIVLISIAIIIGLLNLFKKPGTLKNATKPFEELGKKIQEENNLTRETVGCSFRAANEAVVLGVRMTNDAVIDNVKMLSLSNETKIKEMKEELEKGLGDIRYTVGQNLKEVREDNSKQLAEMRSVVDEKLSSTLNERLSQSFGLISQRLEAVQKGLGEMNELTSGVNDLKKVMSNVKTRGVWGEVSLENLLASTLTKEQYQKGVSVSEKSREQVDFAIILPGKGKDKVYLPIDVKFPTEDYQRLIEASEGSDLEKYAKSVAALDAAIKVQAKSISQKYINPPVTTDFALMYLPTEGLYAEVIRIPGLAEEMQNKYHIIPSGPTNTLAMLNSLQMGFKTLAVQKSSLEVFKVFSAFKKDFNIFVSHLEKVKEQLEKANDTLDDATKRTSIIQKKLDKVEGINYLEEGQEL
ncbi:MAG: DNA recombination protein RmuC [Clostridia bacterium]|nr:DNA recombination protein RmuC [Clostridia bacterium]